MTITPDALRSTRFRVVFRGYEIEAVDQLLDQLEAQLRTSAPSVGSDEHAAAAASDAAGPAPEDHPDPSARALRTIRLAQQMSDQLVAAAGADADQITAAARDAAEATITVAQEQAERLLAEAQERCSRVESEAVARRQQATAALEARLNELQSEVDRLALIEQQHRSGLDQLLRDLQAAVAGPAVT